MRHSFSGLPFALHHNLLYFRVGGTDEKLGAVETDAAQHFDRLHQESRVVDRLGEVDVSEVSGALGHATGAGLATRGAVDDALPRVHEAAQFGSASFVNFRELDASVGHGHSAYLFGAENAELDALYGAHRRLRVARVDGRHDELNARNERGPRGAGSTVEAALEIQTCALLNVRLVVYY